MAISSRFRRMRNSLYRHRRKSSKCNSLKTCIRSNGCKRVKRGRTRYCRKIKNTRRH